MAFSYYVPVLGDNIFKGVIVGVKSCGEDA